MTTPPPADPRIATSRRPGRPTLGRQVARTAKLLGTPLMPHQRQIVDTALELQPDGRPAYWLVIVTIPRQSGKTALCNALLTGRALHERDWRAWYTAQTGQAARKRFRDLEAAVVGGPLGATGLPTWRKSAGDEMMKIGTSRVSVFSPQPDALHGEAVDCVVIDEAWSFDLARGEALLQAAMPAGATRPRRQFWIVSTAGDSTSAWLRQLVDTGRQAAVDDTGTGIAYFEWSADPAAAGTDDGLLAATLAAHPAAGRIIDADYLAAQFEALPRDQFLRAYANMWTAATEAVFDPADWAAAARVLPPPAAGPAVVSVDIAPARNSAAIAVAWDTDTGPACAIAAHAEGTDWAEGETVRLARRLAAPVVIEDAAPAGTLVEPLRRAGITVEALKSRDVARACASMYDTITARAVTLVPDPALDAAAAGAVRRPLGDAYAWGRRKSAADITALCAATYALHQLANPDPEPLLI